MQRSAVCCPRCGAIESTESVTCYRCGWTLRKAVREEPAEGDEMHVVRVLQVSYVIHFIAVLALAFSLGASIWEALLPSDAFAMSLIKLGALRGVLVLEHGEWYRLLTATFAHAGLIHLFFNSTALGAVGPETAKNLGRVRFLLLYFVSGVLANAVSLAWNGAALFQVGASGAICGLIGGLYSIARMRGGFYDSIVRRIVVRWITMIILFGFLMTGADNVAHISGMLVGAGLVRLMGIRPAR